eukprot:TRINITY_DN2770_c0_g1_i1.p1 TRINITY_DN2770_c0_g1~~TRINITY_DN2770_c0_g1_i1.p1  ORF type:complete len:105 (-),score=26.69 TRINITY_DN2770_c0_g1_i1:24-338(-)
MERRLDDFYLPQHACCKESASIHPRRVPRILKLAVSSSSENHQSNYHIDDKLQASLCDVPSWTLRLDGSVEDMQRIRSHKKFTAYVKKLVISIGDKDIIEVGLK